MALHGNWRLVNVTQGMAVPLQIEDNIAANAKSAYFE
jgi:hypothetical protein